MDFVDVFTKYINSGDPTAREWFLVSNGYVPVISSLLYLLAVKVIMPAYMKNREPYNLKTIMIVFNFGIVAVYLGAIIVGLYHARSLDYQTLCVKANMGGGGSIYIIGRCMWACYVLKYIEFLDTIFFALRKKDKQITVLHVSHHFTLPILGWFLFRTEKSGFQGLPVFINATIHVFMYTYYGLAAMGPHLRKYLWWKQYLTLAQMAQFVIILTMPLVIRPLTGCSSTNTTFTLNISGAIFFLVLFYRFYDQSYNTETDKNRNDSTKNKIEAESMNGSTKTSINGEARKRIVS